MTGGYLKKMSALARNQVNVLNMDAADEVQLTNDIPDWRLFEEDDCNSQKHQPYETHDISACRDGVEGDET